MRYLPAIVAAATIAACSGPIEPESPGFEFRSSKVFGVRRSPPEVTGVDGAIAFTGLFEVPHSAFNVTGWLGVSTPRTIHLRIHGTPETGGVQFPTLHFYQSRVSRLPKGNYEVLLSYVVFKGALRDSVVAWTGTVTVR